MFSANLNKSYFDNRQDRYLKLSQSSELCQFFVDIMQTVAQQSFKVQFDQPEPIFLGKHHPYEGDNAQYRLDMEHDLTTLMKSYQSRFPRPASLSDDQALIVPLVQMGMFNINNDRDFNIHLYSHLPRDSKLYLATSYFNMTEEYARELIDRKRPDTTISLLTASPQANGFYGSRGMSQYVPIGYSENEREFVLRAERKCGNDGQIQMLEYFRTQWTYHAKGLWLYEKDKDYPVLTCIGSPNFGRKCTCVCHSPRAFRRCTIHST